MTLPAQDSPVVGITTDLVVTDTGRLKLDCGLAYAERIAAAGGTPVLLPPMLESIPHYLGLCSALVFTGGDDPRTEPFGAPTHPLAKPMHPQRQAFEAALLRALGEQAPRTPVLGVCLGMQMMTLVAGGRLNQHLPDTLSSAADHRGTHDIIPQSGPSVSLRLPRGSVLSNHHQALEHPGKLTVIALSHDGLIEGVADPARPFYIGVQWHPERTENPGLGQQLFDALVDAASRPRP
jgi:putative glutamine amidotransferase